MKTALRDLFIERTDHPLMSTMDSMRAGVERKITRTRRRRWATGGAAVAMAVVAGLSLVVSGGLGARPASTVGSSSPHPSPSPSATQTSAQRRAAGLVAAFDQQVAGKTGHPLVVLIGDLAFETGTVGGGPTDIVKAGRQGHLNLPPNLTVTVPPSAAVAWPDGLRRTVGTVDPQTAIDSMAAEFAADFGPCPNCLRATVTAVHLIEGEVLTSRGPARVPLWAFTVAGSTERPTYPAIDLNDPGVVRVPMTHGSVRVDTRENVVVNSATATADPLRIAVTFSPPFGTASCLQVQPEAVESTSAVAVILVPRLNAPGCEPGHLSAVVTLRQPLGDRLLIDTATGYPTVVYPN